MPKNQPEMKSWLPFHYTRKHLGGEILYAIFGKKNARTVDYWCQDPKVTNKPEGAFDPIQGVKDLLETLDDHGHFSMVRATLEFLASGTSVGCGETPKPEDIKPTINEELLLDYACVAEMHKAIKNKVHPDEIEKLRRQAVDEIDRTYAKYRRDFQK